MCRRGVPDLSPCSKRRANVHERVSEAVQAAPLNQSGSILEIFSNWLGGRKTFCSAELGAQLRQLPLTFTFVRQKFNPVQVDHPITDFPPNSDRLIGAWIFEFDLDVTSHRQVGSGK